MNEIADVERRQLRRTKLQDAVAGIPPRRHEQEIAAALTADKDRRRELQSKFDELATDELERLLALSAQRLVAVKSDG